MDVGKQGEALAENYLKKKGYTILEKNFRYRKGEIDLITEHKGSCIFVEVKTRKNSKYGLPREAVNYHKQKQIYQTAKVFLRNKNLFYTYIQFDVIEVYLDNGIKIIHIEKAFDGNDVEGY